MADPQPDKIEEIDAPVGERKREAWDKLRGYQYQVWFAILLWLRLPPDEDVFIETAEDADQASVSEIIANQLKDRVAGISLNNAAAMEALSNFWTLRDKNPQRRVRFNYITTGDIQQEQSRSFKDGRKGLEVWEMAKTDLQDVGEIRQFLVKKLTEYAQEKTDKPRPPLLPPDLIQLLEKGSPEEIQQKLIQPFTWFPNASSFDQLQEDVKNEIYKYSDNVGETVGERKLMQIKHALFHDASGVATSKFNRRLTARDLRQLFAEETAFQVPSSKVLDFVAAVRTSMLLPIAVNWNACSEDLESWPTTVGADRELERPELELIQQTIGQLPKSAQLLLGEPGAGKSALLAKLSRSLTDQGLPHLGIKADYLPKNLQSLDQYVHGLNGRTLVEAIRELAAQKPFVVLVDQLDALCSLIDQDPTRLTILLQFMREVGDVPGVHIVASCRAFEFNADIRLKHLHGIRRDLALPAWEKVAQTLRAEGANPDDYPAGNQEVLRVPWNLKLFLGLPAPRPVFTSFYDLVGGVWDKATRTASRPEQCLTLVETLAHRIDRTEEFWQPEAVADGFVPEKSLLLQEGVLMKPSGQGVIGFRHQTFFDYFLLRIFLREQTSILRYVEQHGQSFFIRPTVARALAYLRSTDPTAYRDAIRAFMEPGRLRPHLYQLVLEFIGHQQEPNTAEVELMRPMLQNDNEGKQFLKAAIGSRGWFSKIQGADFEAGWMRSTEQKALSAASVLAGVVSSNEVEVTEKLIRNWQGQPQYDEAALWVMSRASEWNDRLVDCFNSYAARIDLKTIRHVLHALIRRAPAKAVMAISARFEPLFAAFLAEAHQLEDAVPETPDPVASEDTLEDALRRLDLLRGDPLTKTVKAFLVGNLFLHVGLERIAVANPQAIFEVFWPSIPQALEFVLDRETEPHLRYDLDSIGRDHDRNTRWGETILGATEEALEQLARTAPERFWRWVDENKASSSSTVHCLIVAGMAEAGPESADKIIAYLSEDHRRLCLGTIWDEQRYSRSLLGKAAEHATPAILENLLAQIADLPNQLLPILRRLRDDLDDDQCRRLLRRDRLSLLAGVPVEHLDALSRGIFEQDKAELGDVDLNVGPHVSTIGAPVTSQELQTMSNEAIVQLTRDIPDGADRAPASLAITDLARSGGAADQAMAVATFGALNPERAREIFEQLQPGQQEKYAAALLSRWAGIDPSPVPRQEGATTAPEFPAAEVEKRAGELHRRGFNSPPFRVDVAHALQTISRKKEGLQDETIVMLKAWLPEITSPSPTQDIFGEIEEPEHSLLFSSHGSWVTPSGRNMVIEAIVVGLLTRKPPAIEETVQFLEELAQSETHPAVWAQTILRASGLFGAMSARMSALVDGLFNTIPTILSYVQTAYFLRQVIGSITPIETEQRWIQKLIDLNKAYFRQLAGELLILSLCRRESDWARSMVDAGLSETYGMAFRRGMTYGAAALIGNERHGEIVEQILIRAMESGKPELSGAAKTFVNNIGEHNWNTSVKHLIQRLFEHDALIQAVEEPLAWRMESVALIDAESALGIAEDLMRKRAARGQQSGWFGAASHMTSIAVEAQRDTSLRDRALSFFEMLLTLDFPEAREAADNMNHR